MARSLFTRANGGADLPPQLDGYGGGHPVPDEDGVRGTRAAVELAEGLGEDDVLLCLVAGVGGPLPRLDGAVSWRR